MSCSLERPPVSTATRTLATTACGPGLSSALVPFAEGGTKRPTAIVTVLPGSAFTPPDGFWSTTRSVLVGSLGLLLADVDLEAAALERAPRRSRWSWPRHVRDRDRPGPGRDRRSRPSSPSPPRAPGSGVWSETRPSSTVSLGASRDGDLEAGRAQLGLGARLVLEQDVGHGDVSVPLETRSVTVEPSTHARRRPSGPGCTTSPTGLLGEAPPPVSPSGPPPGQRVHRVPS